MNRISSGLLTVAVAGVLVGFVTLLSRGDSASDGEISPATSSVGSARLRTPGDSASDGEISPATVTVQIHDWKGVQELIRRQHGRVVVLDIWTTTCETCLEEFPRFVQLQETYPADRLVCISINCDYDGIEGKPPAYYRDDVVKFLKTSRATFQNVMLNIPFIRFLDQIELSSTPAILVYDRDGTLVRRFDNDDSNSESDDFTMQQVQTLIQTLVNRPAIPTD